MAYKEKKSFSLSSVANEFGVDLTQLQWKNQPLQLEGQIKIKYFTSRSY
jgi:hypothetical protein